MSADFQPNVKRIELDYRHTKAMDKAITNNQKNHLTN